MHFPPFVLLHCINIFYAVSTGILMMANDIDNGMLLCISLSDTMWYQRWKRKRTHMCILCSLSLSHTSLLSAFVCYLNGSQTVPNYTINTHTYTESTHTKTQNHHCQQQQLLHFEPNENIFYGKKKNTATAVHFKFGIWFRLIFILCVRLELCIF